MAEKTKILYDGNCIVCDTEIMHYKRIAPDLFEMQDISAPDFKAESFGVTKAAVDRHMHVFTPEGEKKIGVDAFLHIWSRLARYRWAVPIVGSPVVYPLAKVGYRIFADLRPYLPKKHR